MLLSEIFEQLTYGELSQINLGGKDDGGIASSDYPAVVAHINMALTELFKRFPLRLKEIQLQTYSTLTTYQL